MITTGSQTSQISLNWNKKPVTRWKDLSEDLSLKWLCDVILTSLYGQSHIPCFTMFNLQSDEYPWRSKLSNRIKVILKPLTRSKEFSENLSLKLFCDVIFPSFIGQSQTPCFTMSNLQSDEYLWKLNLSNRTRFILKTSNYIQRCFRKS